MQLLRSSSYYTTTALLSTRLSLRIETSMCSQKSDPQPLSLIDYDQNQVNNDGFFSRRALFASQNFQRLFLWAFIIWYYCKSVGNPTFKYHILVPHFFQKFTNRPLAPPSPQGSVFSLYRNTKHMVNDTICNLKHAYFGCVQVYWDPYSAFQRKPLLLLRRWWCFGSKTGEGTASWERGSKTATVLL